MTEAERRESFLHKPVGQRAAIVAAGPIANFLLAILIFAASSRSRQADDAARASTPCSRTARPQAAGFQGRRPDRLDRRQARSRASPTCSASSAQAPAEPLEIEVDRGGARTTLTATPALREIKDNFGNVHRIGVLGITGVARCQPEPVGPLAAVWLGAEETWFVIERTMSYIGGVIVGRESADQLGGPIRIAQVSGQVATLGFVPLMHLAAVLSVSIGLLNLFPDPAARWRSPFVLRDRGDPRPSAVRAGTGIRLPLRARSRC